MQISWDVIANTTSRRRYAPVEIVKCPADKLAEWREVNKNKCQEDPFMPSFSPTMEYANLTKTHFTHAHKLEKQGGRTLFNEGKVPIVYKDEESLAIGAEGPLCVVYGEELWDDKAAIDSVLADDNLNAFCEMQEDEMTCFGVVHGIVNRLQNGSQPHGSQPSALSKADVMAEVRQRGFRSMKQQDWEALVQFRMVLPRAVADVFQTCQFHNCGGRLRVRPADFRDSAEMSMGYDAKIPWVQMGLVLFQFCGSQSTPTQLGPDHSTEAGVFVSLKAPFAKKFNDKAVVQIKHEIDFLVSVETFIKRVFKLYKIRQDPALKNADLIKTRTQFLVSCGRHVLTVAWKLTDYPLGVGGDLEKYRRARALVIAEQSSGRFATIEHYYRRNLFTNGFIFKDDMPEPLHNLEETVEKGAKKPEAKKNTPPQAAPEVTHFDLQGEIVTPLASVFARLCIEGLGGFVRLRTPDLYKTRAANGATDTDPSPIASVQVVAVNLPEVQVKITREDKSEELSTVPADALISIEEEVVADVTPPATIYDMEPDGSQPLVTNIDLDVHFHLWALRSTETLLQELHHNTVPITEGVEIVIMSKEKTLPILLQVRSQRDFKKHELVLAPTGGQLVAESDGHATTLSDLAGKMHEAYVPSLSLTFSTAPSKKQTSLKAGPSQSQLRLYSPLAVKAAPPFDKPFVQAFWGLLRCSRSPQTKPNMALTVHTIDLGKTKTGYGPPVLNAKLTAEVRVPVATNSVPLKKGDLLLLPFHGGEGCV